MSNVVNKTISSPMSQFDAKLRYWTKLIESKYDDSDFYLLRQEYNKLHRAFLLRENVLLSPTKIFIYKGQNYECSEFDLTTTYPSFETTNRIIIFHDFYRNTETSEIIVQVAPIILN